VILFALLACTSPSDDTGAPTGSDDCALVDPSLEANGDYQVAWANDPDPPTAGSTGDFAFQVIGPDGAIVDDLQQVHERMVHLTLISSDLTVLQHLHHEDYYPLDGEVLRCGGYHVPLQLPLSGRWRLGFDYAHQNAFLSTHDWMDVAGSPAMGDTPVVPTENVITVDGLEIELVWDLPPTAGYESQWHLVIREDGEPIDDLVQWLGADAHAVVVSADLGFVSHTHAWSPGMEQMTPGMEMPPLYQGDFLPFHFTFPAAGPHKMWVQFARASAPDLAYTAPFGFEVAP